MLNVASERIGLKARLRLHDRRFILQRRVVLQVSDHVGQRLTVDELHGVEVDRPFTADRVNRDDILVVQVGRRLGLVLEALQLLGVQGGRERQHLEGDAAVERDLLRFIDDAHAAAADFAHQAEVAERRRACVRGQALGRLFRRR